MRLVFNLRDQDPATTKSLGIYNVTMRLLPALADHPDVERMDILANRELAEADLLPRGGMFDRVCRYHFKDQPAPRRWARVRWDHWDVVRACNALQPDWLLLPKGFSPLLRWPRRARVSAYVHDNIFGFYAARGEKPFPAGEARLFRACLRRTAQRAALVVTNSQFTRDEFIRDFAPRGRVVRIGAPLTQIRPTFPGMAPDVALIAPVGAWPHKLTPQAIAWLRRWEDDVGSERAIHCIGALPSGCAWPDKPNWALHPRMDEGQYRALRLACTLVYFSAYEGFGLPPLEASAAGSRVVASDIPALRETLPATALFDNRDYASFRRALDAALTQLPVPPLQAELPKTVAARWIAELQNTGRVTLPSNGAHREA